MQRYTVNQVAQMSGVSVRTLHHYHEIGLLIPATLGENRYRYYAEADLLRLQQILFYRELGMPLKQIAAILDEPSFDRVAALREHRARLEGEANRYRELIGTIDWTLAQLQRESIMRHEHLYKGFSPEKQGEYEGWLVERYGGDMRERIEQSKAAVAGVSNEQWNARMSELAAIESELAACCRTAVPPESATLAPLISRHQAWVGSMWGKPCTAQAYGGLADLYLEHPDFRARYETLQAGFAEYLAAAMKAHAS